MILCGIDVETTGLDHLNDFVIEVAAVLWDTEENKPMKIYNELVSIADIDKNYPSTSFMANKITPDTLKKYGIAPSIAAEQIYEMMNRSEYIMAHNALFDEKFIKAMLHVNASHLKYDPYKPWIDTRYDIPYEANIKTRKLEYLATHYGFTNPFAHRALFDAMTMCKIVSHYPIETILAYHNSKTLLLSANVNFDNKDQAKDRGYFWTGDGSRLDPKYKNISDVKNNWVKEIRELDLPSVAHEAPFKISILWEDDSHTRDGRVRRELKKSPAPKIDPHGFIKKKKVDSSWP